jgi:hypothetical protein
MEFTRKMLKDQLHLPQSFLQRCSWSFNISLVNFMCLKTFSSWWFDLELCEEFMKKIQPKILFFIFFGLPELHLKTSNTHNFWSVCPKNTKFILPRSLLQSLASQKVSKIQKFIALVGACPNQSKPVFVLIVL